MTSPTSPSERTPALYHAAGDRALRGADAAIAAGGGILAIWIVQIGASGAHVPVAAGMALAFAAAIAIVAWVSRRRGATLGIRRARPRYWLAAALIGLSSWYARLALVKWLEVEDDTEALDALISHMNLWLALGFVAILPAIAEELIFRGVIARALAPRSLAGAIVLSSLAFAAYHVLPIQMIAVFPLGLMLALLALRAGSVAPAMLAHALNNACVIAMTRPQLAGVAHAIDAHAGAALAVSSAGTLAGIALAARAAA